MFKPFALSVFALSAAAQVWQPTQTQQPPPPPPFLLTNLPPHATQKVVAQTSVTFSNGGSANCGLANASVACLILSSVGGNQYDGRGNYYFSRYNGQIGRVDSLWKRASSGAFTQFATIPLSASCKQSGTVFTETRGGANLWWLISGGPYGPYPAASGMGNLIASAPTTYSLQDLYYHGDAPTDVLFSVNAASEVLEILTLNSSAVFLPNNSSSGYCNSSGRFVEIGGDNWNVYETVTIAIVQVTLGD